MVALFSAIGEGTAKREGRRKPQAACTWLLGIYIHHPFRATALQAGLPLAPSPLVLESLDACVRARVHVFTLAGKARYASRAYFLRERVYEMRRERGEKKRGKGRRERGRGRERDKR